MDRHRSQPVSESGLGFAERIAELRQETAQVSTSVAGRRFLVVGGTGFLGSHLVDDLLARGAEEVRVLCRTPPAADPGRDPRLTFVTGSVTDRETTREACAEIHAVFHCAAAYGNPPFGRLGRADGLYEVNVEGTGNILAAAAARSVGQLVFTSSMAVVFEPRDRLGVDEDAPYASGPHLDHYTRSKIAAERMVLRASCDTLHTAALRPSGIFGPGEQYITHKVLPMARLLRGIPFSLDPAQRMDWTFVYNLVWAHMLWLHADLDPSRDVAGRAYFITDGEPMHTLEDVIASILRAAGHRRWTLMRVPSGLMIASCGALERVCWWLRGLGLRPPFTRMEATKAVTTATHSTARARRLLGYEPLISTREGLRHMSQELAARLG